MMFSIVLETLSFITNGNLLYLSDPKIAAAWNVYSIDEFTVCAMEFLFEPCKQIYSDSFFGMAIYGIVYIIKDLIYSL